VLLVAKLHLHELLCQRSKGNLRALEVSFIDLGVEIKPVYLRPRGGLTREFAHEPDSDSALNPLPVFMSGRVIAQHPGWTCRPHFFP
jgi:hypothetical protein